jgi:hypothetical protein
MASPLRPLPAQLSHAARTNRNRSEAAKRERKQRKRKAARAAAAAQLFFALPGEDVGR